MTDPSHRRKLARAEAHIKNVEALIGGWKGDGYRTFDKAEGKGRFVMYAEQLKPLPDDLPLVIGDALHTLRDSLDHVVFALAKKHTPAMTPEDEEETQFPFSRKGEAITTSNRYLQLLSPRAIDDVCLLSPDSTRQQLNTDPLWLLNKVSNRDKHREIALAPSAVPTTHALRIYSSDASDYFRTFGSGRLQMGADPVPIIEYTRGPNLEAEVVTGVNVLFDQGTEVADREVVATLRWFHDHIRDTVFKRLETHL